MKKINLRLTNSIYHQLSRNDTTKCLFTFISSKRSLFGKKTIKLKKRDFEFNIDKLQDSSNEVQVTKKSLKSFLIEKISSSGPITIEEYMEHCLFHPLHGYYSTKDFIFGNQGDFITAPEITNLFGETIAVWIYKQLEMYGFPKKYDLLEFGPGRGFLAIDILKSIHKLQLFDGLNYYLVDKSAKLVKLQKEGIFDALVKLKQKPVYKKIKPNEISFLNVSLSIKYIYI